MGRYDVLGTWKSFMTTGLGGTPQAYDRQTLTFNANGTGSMHSRTLFGRNRSFTWEYVPEGPYGYDYFIIHNLGGPGAVAMGSIEDGGSTLVVLEGSMMTAYREQ